MWNRLLARIAPLVDEDVSELDRRDGVSTRAHQAPATDNQPARQG